MIRGVLCEMTRHKIRGTIDTPLPRFARTIEEFRLQAVSPPVAGQEKRREGGRR